MTLTLKLCEGLGDMLNVIEDFSEPGREQVSDRERVYAAVKEAQSVCVALRNAITTGERDE